MKKKIVIFFIIAITVLYVLYPKDNNVLDTYYANKITPINITLIGEVVYPGTYTFINDITLNEVINYAGGLLPTASDEVDLYMLITKSTTITIPKLNNNTNNNNINNNKININNATFEELITIPNIGRETANNIINYISEHGYISNYDDMLNIKNIGKSTLEKIKPYIRFN